MITAKPMTIEDFLAVMETNAEFYPEFAALPDEQKRFLANLNILTGTAQTYFDDGKFFGVGGIRYVGLGEAWLTTTPKMREEQKLKLFKATKDVLLKTIDTLNLWRVFAESKISENFLEHLGFDKAPSTHIWTRTK